MPTESRNSQPSTLNPKHSTLNPKPQPFVQVIRGLPGSGKSTLAKQFDCLHLELDMFCVRGRRYVWSPEADRIAHNLIDWHLRDEMREGIDLVVCGVMPKASGTLSHILGYAREFGYTVYVETLTTDYGNEHGCRQCDLSRFRSLFESGSVLKESVERLFFDARWRNWLRENVRYGLMPKRSVIVPYEEG